MDAATEGMASTNESAGPALPKIYTLRKQKVVLDSDLAALFGVETKVFNQAIRRNSERFPLDFAFQVGEEELANLRSQFVTSSSGMLGALRSQDVTLKKGRGMHRKYLPWVFTEHGAIMAAMVLRSDYATKMSVYVVRAFVKMRDELTANLGILRRLAEMDKKLIEHDVVLREVLERLQPLLNPPPEKPKPKIGFHRGNR
jgi:ORF6N domain